MSTPVDIDLHFVRKARLVPEKETKGYVFADFFRDQGLKRAQACSEIPAARKILADTYKGIDTQGIGVVWIVKEAYPQRG